MDINSRIREKIEPALRKAGILAAAKHLNISDAAIHRWLKGQSSLSADTLVKLADFAGYEVTQKIEIRKKKGLDKD